MRSFAVEVVCVATLLAASLTGLSAQTADPPKYLNRADAIHPPAMCMGLLCDLTPRSMTPPLTALQALELEKAWHATAHARVTNRGGLRAATGRRLIVAHSSLDSTASQQKQVAIFSLFDPVIKPGDYGAWLRRIPRSRSSQQAAVPTFAKRREG